MHDPKRIRRHGGQARPSRRGARLFALIPFVAWIALASAGVAVAEEEEPAEIDAAGQAAGTAEGSTLVETVVVTATRAGERTPATHTNVSREAIDQEHSVEDFPALLRITPSVYSYSDSGNDVGYSYLRIRGFDQRRVAVTINGTPLNDAESHEVFWIDLPNLADSLEDVQIQRGVGTSLYGQGAIGGSVNLETMRLAPGGGMSAELGAGSYGTNKQFFGWSSDLVRDRWQFGVQASRIATDGYRYQSWSRMGMGFFTAQRFGEKTVFRINLYGGKEDSHLAYEGITREQLLEDRRYNPLDWSGEQDHFTQPHLEAIHEWAPNENLLVGNTVYAFYGRGYFDQFRETKDLYELHLADEPWIAEATNVFRERWVDEWDFGWIPKATLKHRNGTLTAGAEIRVHRGHHFGDVVADDLPEGTAQPYRYYDYRIPKNSLVLYAQEEWTPSPVVTVLAGLQRVQHSWSLEDDLVTGYSYDVDYDWWAPRIGAGFNMKGGWSAFASISQSRREPAVKDLYDPQDAYDAPAFREGDDTGRLWDPIPEEEKLTDYEAGFAYESSGLTVRTTLYSMDFEDEIVYLGGLNDLGQAVTGNADRSTHRGFELEAAGRLSRTLSLSGHLTVSDDRHDEFIETAWNPDLGDFEEVDRSGNRIAGFPARLARLALAWQPVWGRVELSGSHAGRIYLDNSETDSHSIEPYEVFNLDVRYNLPLGRNRPFALRVRVDNLLDTEYESFGYVAWGTPLFIPAAGRRAFFMLSWAAGGS